MVMRRQQLVDLATAYGVAIVPDATKAALLPILLAAEEQGAFKVPPKRPFYVARAMRRSDDPPLAVEAPREEQDAAPVLPVPVATTDAPPRSAGRTGNFLREHQAMIKRARDLGLHLEHNLKALKAADLKKLVAETEAKNAAA